MISTHLTRQLVDAVQPNLLQLRKIFIWRRTRYRRGHVSHLRYRQRRRLGEGCPMTIFVKGITPKSIPLGEYRFILSNSCILTHFLVVTPSTRVANVIETLQTRRCLPTTQCDLTPFYLIGPYKQVSGLTDDVLDLTMQELGLKTLSTLHLRVRLLGGWPNSASKSPTLSYRVRCI